MKSAERLLESLFDVRRNELRRVLLMSAYLLLIIAAYSVTKAVRDSLFVTKIGPAQLPYVYLLIAAAMGLVSLVYSRAVQRIGLHGLIRTTMLIAIVNLVLFWMVFRRDSAPWFYVLYVWVSLFGAITASQFWLLATHVFNPREARRLFSRIGLGGILGGVFGGALTNRMAHWLGTESLLLVCAGMMTATIVILQRVRPHEAVTPKPKLPESGGEPRTALFQQVRQSRQLVMMVLLMSIAVVVEAFIDYEYKVIAKQTIASKDHLTAFFGSITFYVGIFALFFQLLFTNRILKRFGVGVGIQLLPAGLFIAFVALGVQPGLWTAAVLQLIDGAFSYSIHRSGMELLYLPIAPETRNAVKGFIDTFVDRTGRALGALLLLLFTGVLAVSISSLSFVAAGLVVVWMVLALAVGRQYMDSFRRALERKTIEPEALELRNVDAATMRTLLGLLSSSDERQVLYALDLLSNSHPDRWRDHINLLIQHRSAAVRARTIAVLAGWNDPAIAREEFINHPDYDTARIATAVALRLHWTDGNRGRELLNRLLADSSPAVAREAIATAGIVGHVEAISFLIEALANRRLRRDARQALLKFGDSIIPVLIRRLADRSEEPAIRKRIPKTLALTGNQAAADALIRQVHRLNYHLDYAVLKALNRMRVNWPEIIVDRDLVGAAIDREREEHDNLGVAHAWLTAHRVERPAFSLLIRAVEERLEQRLERIFRLVGMIYSPHDIYSVYYNCRLKPALRPAAIEFLDNILDAELKLAIVPLLEAEGSGAENESRKTELFRRSGGRLITSLEDALQVVESADPWLATIANELQTQLGEEFDDSRERRLIRG
jgi:ATP/ADP translocase